MEISLTHPSSAESGRWSLVQLTKLAKGALTTLTRSRLEWQGAYQAAILETDDSKLLEKIVAAEGVIGLRIQSLIGLPHDGEGQELDDALRALRVLRKERL